MNNKTISVLTLVNGRAKAFENFVKGLSRSNIRPDELIVVFMNQEVLPISDLPFPVKCFQLNTIESLPLAAARNKAAKEASGDILIFLDVDCIADEDLIGNYNTLNHSDKLLVGTVRYLEQYATEHPDFLNHLNQLSKPDPIRTGVNPLPYELFWSLNFACSKKTYNEIGGFDEDFKGYGGEDTDFGFKARVHKIPLDVTQALAFHQHHPSYSPPLNHFSDIITNAECFFKKWKIWPMEGWLNQFERMGLILKQSEQIKVLRLPTQIEIEQALKY